MYATLNDITCKPKIFLNTIASTLVALLILVGCRASFAVDKLPSTPQQQPAQVISSSRTDAENQEEIPNIIQTLEPLPTVIVDSAPAPEPIGTVELYEGTVTLPTYPLQAYQSSEIAPTFNSPYTKLDYERFRANPSQPVDRTYRTIILENNYIQLIILPELGGRLWQVTHKGAENRMFYQNEVVKPSPWGPAKQLGWIALGGLEWNLPVIEHGYDWGTPWGFSPVQHNPESATVTLFTPWDGRLVSASIAISLRAGAASFDLQPTISNVSQTELEFDYWHSAMLAPGPQNTPSGSLHFILPTNQMIVHSTGDDRLPAPTESFPWPIYNSRDISMLESWSEYAGFFESPSASGPFAAVYDRLYDAGAVRIFPADVARGSKIFSPGWQSPLPTNYYTDDESSYVELHGGLAPSFFEHYQLPAGGSVTWREVWYPLQGIGDMVYANEVAAVNLSASAGGLTVGFYPTRPISGDLLLYGDGVEILRFAIDASPELPFVETSAIELDDTVILELRFEDSAGRILLSYRTG